MLRSLEEGNGGGSRSIGKDTGKRERGGRAGEVLIEQKQVLEDGAREKRLVKGRRRWWFGKLRVK